MQRGRKLLAVLFVGIMLVSGCSQQKKQQAQDTENRARQNDLDMEEAITTGVDLRIDSQPIPVFPFSQEYQTLLDILTVRATGTHGTMYLRNLAGDVIEWCPTQGGPIPSTYQSTPSEHYVDIKGDDTRDKKPVDLPEPTGVIPGDSDATWVLCLDDQGRGFPQYMEPAAEWTGATRSFPSDTRIRVDEITYRFATNEDEARENYDALCEDEIITDCG